MDLLSRLKTSENLTLLCGASVTVGEEDGGVLPYSYAPVELERGARNSDYALLGVHYYTHVLARYPREDGRLDKYGMILRQVVSDIIEQGIWPGSNLIKYAGLKDKVRMAGTGQSLEGRRIESMLMRTVTAEDLDLALEVPDGVEHEALLWSVPVLLQGMTDAFDEPSIELLDRALRYVRVYIGEGANYGSLAAAQNLANRAFREAGGQAI